METIVRLRSWMTANGWNAFDNAIVAAATHGTESCGICTGEFDVRCVHRHLGPGVSGNESHLQTLRRGKQGRFTQLLACALRVRASSEPMGTTASPSNRYFVTFREHVYT